MKKPKVHHKVGAEMKRREQKTRSLTVNPPTVDVGADDILGREADAQIPRGLEDLAGWDPGDDSAD